MRTPVEIETIMQRRRKVAGYLRFIEKTEFDITTWECGTTACAVGHMCRAEIDGWEMFDELDETGEKHAVPYWDGHASFDAVQAYFGLTLMQASRVFGGVEAADNYNVPNVRKITPEMVADMLLSLPPPV